MLRSIIHLVFPIDSRRQLGGASSDKTLEKLNVSKQLRNLKWPFCTVHVIRMNIF